ncbi:hypothetical protein ACU8V7_23240 [Zobellia nedashkovskayae]
MANEANKNKEINSSDLRNHLLKTQVEFSEKALQECLTFLALDNKIISHFEEIMSAVKDDIKKNPDRFYAHSSQQVKNVDDFNDISGSGFLDGLGDLIKEVIIKDKDLIRDIIGKVFGL